MDQDDYYTHTLSILVKNNKEIIMKEHINNIHQIISNYINKKEIDNSIILELQSEINNYKQKLINVNKEN
jgi:hypothetical protein